MNAKEMSIAIARKVNGWNARDWERVKELFAKVEGEDFDEFAWDLAIAEILKENK